LRGPAGFAAFAETKAEQVVTATIKYKDRKKIPGSSEK
jgi:hypothetical protein